VVIEAGLAGLKTAKLWCSSSALRSREGHALISVLAASVSQVRDVIGG
jgi:hypothetical protein